MKKPTTKDLEIILELTRERLDHLSKRAYSMTVIIQLARHFFEKGLEKHRKGKLYTGDYDFVRFLGSMKFLEKLVPFFKSLNPENQK